MKSKRFAVKLSTNDCFDIIEKPADIDMLLWLYNEIDTDIVQPVYGCDLPASYLMVVDEEGLLKDSPFNPIASQLSRYPAGYPIVGHAVIVKQNKAGDDWELMTEREALDFVFALSVRLVSGTA